MPRTVNRCGSQKPNYMPFQIEHRHGSKFGTRSNVTSEQFHHFIATGDLVRLSAKVAIVREGYLAIIDRQTKDIAFIKATGRVSLNWDLIKRHAIYYKPSTALTVKQRHDEGQFEQPLEPEFQKFERFENGQKVVRQRLLYYSMPLC